MGSCSLAKKSNHFLLLAILSMVCLPSCSSVPTEGQLLDFVLGRYPNKNARPPGEGKDIFNQSTVTVYLRTSLQKIGEINEDLGTMTTLMWLTLEWTDQNLRWNKTEWDGKEQIRLGPGDVWTPDIEIYNAVLWESLVTPPHKTTRMVVSSDGSVLWITPWKVTTTCNLDLHWFPYDRQECNIKFGSWSYNGWEVDLNVKDGYDFVDDSGMVRNEDWDFIGAEGRRNSISYDLYDCCPEPYVSVTVTVTVQRKILPYYSQVILPAFVSTFIAVLSLLMPAHTCSTARFLLLFFCFCHLILAASSIKVPNLNNNYLRKYLLSPLFTLITSLFVFTIIVVNIAAAPVTNLHGCTKIILKLIIRMGCKLCCINIPDSKLEDDQVLCVLFAKGLDYLAFVIFMSILVNISIFVIWYPPTM